MFEHLQPAAVVLGMLIASAHLLFRLKAKDAKN